MWKYILTDTKIEVMGATLFQIKATASFWDVSKGDLGGYIQKEDNLSMSWNAWVSWDSWVFWNSTVTWNSWVSWNAHLEAGLSYKKWWFIGWDNTGKITDITDKTWSDHWENQYVLWDYEIEDLEEKTEIKEMTVEDISKVLGYEVKIIK